MLRIAMLGVYADQALGSTFRRIYAPFLRIPHYDATSDIWQLPAGNTTSLQPHEAERIGELPVRSDAVAVEPGLEREASPRRNGGAALVAGVAPDLDPLGVEILKRELRDSPRRLRGKAPPRHAGADPVADLEPRHRPVDPVQPAASHERAAVAQVELQRKVAACQKVRLGLPRICLRMVDRLVLMGPWHPRPQLVKRLDDRLVDRRAVTRTRRSNQQPLRLEVVRNVTQDRRRKVAHAPVGGSVGAPTSRCQAPVASARSSATSRTATSVR